VGLVALYLLEGAKPDAKALIEHFAAHGTPKAPRGIPEPLWQVIATLLQPDPNSRFRTATGARKALAAAIELLPEPGPDDELVEVFDQLGPLPTGFAPEGPLHRASGLDKTGTGAGVDTSGTSSPTPVTDTTPPPPHHPPAYGPPPMGPPSQPGADPALPAPFPGSAPQPPPPYTATGSISPPPMPTTSPPQTDPSSSGKGSGFGTGTGAGAGAGAAGTDPSTGAGASAGTVTGTSRWSQDSGASSSASPAQSPHPGHISPGAPPSDVPPRPERAPAPQPSTMSDTGSFHLPPPQVLTTHAASRQIDQHAPDLGHPQQHPEQQASPPAGTPLRTAPAQHLEPAHVPSPQSHPQLGLSQNPAAAVQHAYASTGSYTARPPEVPRRSRALPRRRPGPPVKVVLPVLLLALACFAVGFWALGQL
jgi:hypothetical protein